MSVTLLPTQGPALSQALYTVLPPFFPVNNLGDGGGRHCIVFPLLDDSILEGRRDDEPLPGEYQNCTLIDKPREREREREREGGQI